MRTTHMREVRLLLLLMHTLQKYLCYDYFQMEKNSPDDGYLDPGRYDCKPGMSVFNPPPCFAGDVRLNVIVNEGETAHLRCYIYNVDFNKTFVSWWKDFELQEITLHLQTNSRRAFLPRQFNEDWTLVIRNVQTNDAGRYLCQINSRTVLEKMFHLEVIGTKPVNTLPEIRYTHFPKRSSSFIIPEKSYRPQNDERYQTKPFLLPTTTSLGKCNVIFMKYLLSLPTLIKFAFLILL